MDSTLLEMKYMREAALFSLETNAFEEPTFRGERCGTARKNGLAGFFFDVDIFLAHYKAPSAQTNLWGGFCARQPT